MMQYQTAAIRQFLQEYFSVDELEILLFDYFRAVHDNVTPLMPKAQQIQMLLEYCDDHGRFPILLDQLAQRRPQTFERAAFVAASAPPADTAVPPTNGHASPAAATPSPRTMQHPKTGKTMLFVPAGDFLYGERPQTVTLDSFWIDRTPVTNGDYARFVTETHHPAPRHWQGQTPPAELLDHPVVWVTWHDAQAYAVWAGLQLPTEQQWERAARGTDGRFYPWGNRWIPERCNSSESGRRTTTSVGSFSPAGDSPVGCVDMAGNVWEWTDSWYDDTQNRRVVRGGAWNANRQMSDVTARRKYTPSLAHDHYGFRLAAPAVKGDA